MEQGVRELDELPVAKRIPDGLKSDQIPEHHTYSFLAMQSYAIVECEKMAETCEAWRWPFGEMRCAQYMDLLVIASRISSLFNAWTIRILAQAAITAMQSRDLVFCTAAT